MQLTFDTELMPVAKLAMVWCVARHSHVSVWFVLVLTVCVTCGSVHKIVCIYLVRHYNGSESMY